MNPAAAWCPPPLIIISLSRAFFIVLSILKSNTDLADPFKISLEFVITIEGLLK